MSWVSINHMQENSDSNLPATFKTWCWELHLKCQDTAWLPILERRVMTVCLQALSHHLPYRVQWRKSNNSIQNSTYGAIDTFLSYLNKMLRSQSCTPNKTGQNGHNQVVLEGHLWNHMGTTDFVSVAATTATLPGTMVLPKHKVKALVA